MTTRALFKQSEGEVFGAIPVLANARSQPDPSTQHFAGKVRAWAR